MTSQNHQPIDFLEKTLRAAGDALAQAAADGLDVSLKPDTSLVTKADLASEKVIVDAIRLGFPNDVILAEESGLSSAERRPGQSIWIIDPLDGTTNFANRYPFYCVSIGRGCFDEQGRIDLTMGGIYEPARERMFLAAKGAGATVNGQPLQVAAARDFALCFLVTGFYYMKDEALQREIRRFERVAQDCQSIRRDGSAALDLAYAAEGVFDAFWEVGLQPWDLAAGAVIVEEAGGVVRNYAEGPFDIEGEGVIAGSAQAVGEIARRLG